MFGDPNTDVDVFLVKQAVMLIGSRGRVGVDALRLVHRGPSGLALCLIILRSMPLKQPKRAASATYCNSASTGDPKERRVQPNISASR